MELKQIVNRVVPSISRDPNWNFFLNKVVGLINPEIFTKLRKDEKSEEVDVDISKFYSSKETMTSIERGNSIEVSASCHNGTATQQSSVWAKVNGVKITRGTYVGITYQEAVDEFIVSETYDTTILAQRGANAWIIDPSDGTLVAFVRTDTYNPLGQGAIDNDLVNRAVDKLVEVLRGYLNQGYCLVYLSADASSCNATLRAFFKSIGGLSEGEFMSKRRRHYFVGTLNDVVVTLAYEEISEDPTAKVMECPYGNSGILGISTENLIANVIAKTAASSKKDGIDGPGFEEFAELSDDQPYMVATFDIVSKEGDVFEVEGYIHVGTKDVFTPDRIKYGELDKGIVKYYDTCCGALLAAATKKTVFVVVFTDATGSMYSLACPVNIIVDDSTSLEQGTYESEYVRAANGTDKFAFLPGIVVELQTEFTRIRVKTLNFSPNNIRSLYASLFGTYVDEIFSYAGLSQACNEQGVNVDTLVVNATGGVTEKAYKCRKVQFISIAEDLSSGYGFIAENLYPYKDAGIHDRIKGDIVINYLAKVHDTDKLELITSTYFVDLEVVSYDKGIFQFRCAQRDGEIIKSILSKQLIGYTGATVVRKNSAYMWGASVQSLGGLNENLLERINRDLSEGVKSDNKVWSLIISVLSIKTVKAARVVEVPILGNDSFSIDTHVLPEWINVTLQSGSLDAFSVLSGVAPNVLRIAISENDTEEAREGIIKVRGAHDTEYNITVTQVDYASEGPSVNGVDYDVQNPITAVSLPGSGGQITIGIKTASEWSIKLDNKAYADAVSGILSGEGEAVVILQVARNYQESDYRTRRFSIDIEYVGETVYLSRVAVFQDCDYKFEAAVEYDESDTDQPGLRINTVTGVAWLLIAAGGQQEVVFSADENPQDGCYQSSWPATLQGANTVIPEEHIPSYPENYEDILGGAEYEMAVETTRSSFEAYYIRYGECYDITDEVSNTYGFESNGWWWADIYKSAQQYVSFVTHESPVLFVAEADSYVEADVVSRLKSCILDEKAEVIPGFEYRFQSDIMYEGYMEEAPIKLIILGRSYDGNACNLSITFDSETPIVKALPTAANQIQVGGNQVDAYYIVAVDVPVGTRAISVEIANGIAEIFSTGLSVDGRYHSLGELKQTVKAADVANLSLEARQRVRFRFVPDEGCTMVYAALLNKLKPASFYNNSGIANAEKPIANVSSEGIYGVVVKDRGNMLLKPVVATGVYKFTSSRKADSNSAWSFQVNSRTGAMKLKVWLSISCKYGSLGKIVQFYVLMDDRYELITMPYEAKGTTWSGSVEVNAGNTSKLTVVFTREMYVNYPINCSFKIEATALAEDGLYSRYLQLGRELSEEINIPDWEFKLLGIAKPLIASPRHWLEFPDLLDNRDIVVNKWPWNLVTDQGYWYGPKPFDPVGDRIQTVGLSRTVLVGYSSYEGPSMLKNQYSNVYWGNENKLYVLVFKGVYVRTTAIQNLMSKIYTYEDGVPEGLIEFLSSAEYDIKEITDLTFEEDV